MNLKGDGSRLITMQHIWHPCCSECISPNPQGTPEPQTCASGYDMGSFMTFSVSPITGYPVDSQEECACLCDNEEWCKGWGYNDNLGICALYVWDTLPEILCGLYSIGVKKSVGAEFPVNCT